MFASRRQAHSPVIPSEPHDPALLFPHFLRMLQVPCADASPRVGLDRLCHRRGLVDLHHLLATTMFRRR